MSSWILWWLGRPDAALREARATVRRPSALGSFLSLAMARHFLGMVHQLRREPEAALDQARRNAEFAGRSASRSGRGRRWSRPARSARDWAIPAGSTRSAAAWPCSATPAAAPAPRAASGCSPRRSTRRQHGGSARDRGRRAGARARARRALLGRRADAAQGRLHARRRSRRDGRSRGAGARRASGGHARGAGSLALRAATTLGQLLVEEGRAAEAGPPLAGALAAMDDGGETADALAARPLLDNLPTEALEAKEIR